MKLGLSSYSFRPLMQDGSMRIEDVFAWVRDHGGEHVELASLSVAPEGGDLAYELGTDAASVARLQATMTETGIPLSGICIGANFIQMSAEERRMQIGRAQRYAETCDMLGARFLRHDVAPWAFRAGTAEFEAEFAGIVDACGEIASHAARYGVTTSVEDHGFFMNSSERIKRLVHAVNLPNFRITLDVGNFLCVDEDAVTATAACLPQLSFLHLKDFYVRRSNPGAGWIETRGGQYIRGSIFGFGDLDTRTILKSAVDAGYNGFVSLEYEGGEPSLVGCETGLNNIRRMLEELRA